MIELIPHEKRTNHLRIKYQGVVVADGIRCPSGRIEVRPRAKHFAPLHRTHKVLTLQQVEEWVLLSDVGEKR